MFQEQELIVIFSVPDVNISFNKKMKEKSSTNLKITTILPTINLRILHTVFKETVTRDFRPFCQKSLPGPHMIRLSRLCKNNCFLKKYLQKRVSMESLTPCLNSH